MAAKFSKREKLEMLIVLLVFGAAFFLPFCTYYYFGKGENDILEKPRYVSNFPLGFVYLLFMIIVLFGLFSKDIRTLTVVSFVIGISLLVTFVVIKLLLAFWGASPYHPEMGSGFVLMNISIIYFIIRSFFWLKREPVDKLDW